MLRRGAGAVTLLALVVGGLALGAEQRETARVAGLAGAPGVVTPALDGPVTVAWRPRELPVAGLRTVADRVVGPARTPDGGLDAVALDPRTGDRLWRTRLAGPAAGSSPLASCEAPEGSDRGSPVRWVVVCVVVDDTDVVAPAGIGSAVSPTSARLVVLDAVTGAPWSDRPVPPTTTLAVVGADVVLAHVHPDGTARLRRVDPRDGAVRWRFRAPDAATVDPLGLPRLVVRTDGDLVLVDAGPVWALAARTGEVLRAWPAPDCPEAARRGTELLPGRGAVFRPGGGTTAGTTAGAGAGAGAGASAGEVVDVRTGRGFAVDGAPATLAADDGSLADVVVVDRVDRGGRTAYDLRSGRVAWTSPDVPVDPALVLGGRLVSLHAGVVRAVEGRTGRPVWTADLGTPDARSLATDGRLVLVTHGHGAGRTTLTAVHARDGRSRWSTALGTDVDLRTAGGGLYGVAEDGPVALAAPRDR